MYNLFLKISYIPNFRFCLTKAVLPHTIKAILIFHERRCIQVRMLKFTLICCMAMILVIGCASEKKMESKATEASQPAAAKMDATAKAPAAAEQITLAVTGMT